MPACIRLRKHLQLTNVGEKLNMPYPPFLGGRRHVDLIIALDYGASEPFQVGRERLCKLLCVVHVYNYLHDVFIRL